MSGIYHLTTNRKTINNFKRNTMRIQEGQFAPGFFTTDVYGKEVNLINYKGKKIIIGFYRNVSCPFCNRRVHKIIGNSVRLRETGVEILFFFESSPEKIKSSVFHQGIIPWPIIGDPEKKIYNQYGVESSLVKNIKTMFHSNLIKAKKDTRDLNLPKDKDASLNLVPADIFIDENLKVVKAHYGEHMDDHVSFEEIEKFAGLRSR